MHVILGTVDTFCLLRQIGGDTTIPGVAGIPPELHLLLKVLTQCGKIIRGRVK
jgi:hypothetical protein